MFLPDFRCSVTLSLIIVLLISLSIITALYLAVVNHLSPSRYPFIQFISLFSALSFLIISCSFILLLSCLWLASFLTSRVILSLWLWTHFLVFSASSNHMTIIFYSLFPKTHFVWTSYWHFSTCCSFIVVQ